MAQLTKNSVLLLLAFVAPFLGLAQEELRPMQRYVQDVDQKIPELMKDFSIPGAAVAIIENGKVIHKKCYGLSDVSKGTHITPTTGFNIGSISKTITGWGVMKLVEDGKLDLDEPVETYLTRWHIPESEFNADGVTLRRLLSHTAGINLGSVSREISFDQLPTLVGWLNGDNDGMGAAKIAYEPGTEWHYSGGGFGIAQLVIEEVTGQTFEDFMQAEIIDPLGMTNSGFKITEKIRNASATPYDDYGVETQFGLYTVQSAAGFHTTLDDFIRFMIASLPNHPDHDKVNKILKPETVLQMHEPAPNSMIGGWKYGLGYQSVHFDDGRIYLGHGGSNTGWQANFRIEAETMDGFIAFTNGTSGDRIASPLFCKLSDWTSPKNPGQNECWWKKSISRLVNTEIKENGVKNLKAFYDDAKEKYAEEYDFSESELNNLGYNLLEEKDFEKALAVFKLNTEAYPYAYNAYDSYGEASLASGDTVNAIKNYRYSVKLNPENQIGASVLQSLGESIDDLHVEVPLDHLKQLTGEYASTFGTDKIITYGIEDGYLVRAYENGDSRRLIPLGNDEFVYHDWNVHVRFEASADNKLLLHVNHERIYEKVK